MVGGNASVLVGGLQHEEPMPPVVRYRAWRDRPGRDCSGCGLVSERELLGCAAAKEPVCSTLSGDDFGAGGDVEVGLAGVAEPAAVAGAGLGGDGVGRGERPGE